MKKTNKKGFTLVELLAVIVILGVLLMIAVPAVQNVIKSSRKKAFESAAKLAIENAETMASSYNISGSAGQCIVFINDQNYTPKGGTATNYKGMELERGDFGTNAIGYIRIDTEGKGTIYIQNDAYAILEKTLKNSADLGTTASSGSTKTQATPKSGEYAVCQWVETK
ncbi:putative uncharacterized protein [Clostridium sp. CAG:710]|nr:putative uncharacterized protein [Clostridium sp. CAG:710]